MNTRLHHIDQLRGIAACGIMFFHFVSSQYGELPAESILGRIGIYGVSLFYVISGIALGHVYGSSKIQQPFPYRSFFIKRYFRLMPLLILATIATIVVSKKSFDLTEIILNLTGLFSLFDYQGGIATGSWSIGNEWVFYLMLPTLLAIWSHRNRMWKALLWLFTIGITILFASAHPDTLATYWPSYIHPFNQCIFFIAGSYIGFHRFYQRPIDWKIPILGALALLFFFYCPISGDRIGLVTGINRLTLTLSVLCIALAWYRINIRFWSPIEQSLLKLGDWSYSIYLLHPLVWIFLKGGLKWMAWELSDSAVIVIAVAVSILASYLTYRFLELPCMQWVTHRLHRQPATS